MSPGAIPYFEYFLTNIKHFLDAPFKSWKKSRYGTRKPLHLESEERSSALADVAQQ